MSFTLITTQNYNMNKSLLLLFHEIKLYNIYLYSPVINAHGNFNHITKFQTQFYSVVERTVSEILQIMQMI